MTIIMLSSSSEEGEGGGEEKEPTSQSEPSPSSSNDDEPSQLLHERTLSSGSLSLSEASKVTEITASTSTTSSSSSSSSSQALLLLDPPEAIIDTCTYFPLPYAPSKLESARIALSSLQERLGPSEDELVIESMKESFDCDLLTQFYDELMIPNFPLEEERDNLQDWLLYLDPNRRRRRRHDHQQTGDLRDHGGPGMDVLILRRGHQVIAGIAFEYYPQAQSGLLSYMVVGSSFRRKGILATLHPVFVEALQTLHETTCRTTSPIRAILAETNTAAAGDVPPAVARKRHQILFQLGYRLLQFPYVQPPLSTDVEGFDDIMLLLYVGNDVPSLQNVDDNQNDGEREENDIILTTDNKTAVIDTQVLYDYVLDFYHSVFGYTNLEFRDHWYYRLVSWYVDKHPVTEVSSSLPWEDVTPSMRTAMLSNEETEKLGI